MDVARCDGKIMIMSTIPVVDEMPIDEALDDALAMTFPASDPVSITSASERALFLCPLPEPLVVTNLRLSPHELIFNGIF